MDLYPLLMTPYFRHGEETPWGGHALKERYGKDAPDDTTGESLEISALPGRESRIANGPLAGKTLSEVIALWGNELTGSANGEFPLLLKLLDAQEYLSVQVHPNEWHSLGPETDASFLSDEACMEGWFTGTMAGLCCQDLTGFHLPADFDYFSMHVQD